jgi:hypothetical protein
MAKLTQFEKTTRNLDRLDRNREELKRAIAARRRAKKVGNEAGVLIAKARKAKVKKAKLTSIAQEANFAANEERARARNLTKYLAYDTGMYTTDKDGKKRYFKKKALKNQALKKAEGKKTNPIFDTIQKSNRYAVINAEASKAAARQSGGTATGIKRTAEAAIGRIATGKALKGMARAGGVLGIAALFNAALKGNDSKKKRG